MLTGWWAKVVSLILLLTFLPGCAGLLTEVTTALDINPLALQRALSRSLTEEERLEARQVDREILNEYRVVTDPRIVVRVEKIVNNLVRVSHKKDLHPTVRILDSKELNAFVTGGEYVYVYRGLLDAVGSDDELAGILAHELGHLDAGHITRGKTAELWTNLALAAADKLTKGETADEIIQAAAALISPAYSREHEREADILGAVYASRAGYNPTRLVDFFNKAWKQEEQQQLEMERSLREAYNELVEVCEEYEVANQTHQAYGTPETYAEALKAYNGCLQAQQQFGEAKAQYNAFVAGSSPLFRSHPVNSERIAAVLGVSEYLKGKRSLDSLNEAPTIQKVIDTLHKVEAREAAQPYFDEALAYHRQGALDKAGREYQKAIEADPSFSEAYVNLAFIHADQGLQDKAIEEYERGLTLNPNILEAQKGLGYLYVKKERAEEAITALKKAIPLKDPAIHLTLASLYRKKGQIDQATAQYRRAISLRPQDAEAYFQLGVCYQEAGKRNDARKAFQQTLAIKPDLKEAKDYLSQLEAAENTKAPRRAR